MNRRHLARTVAALVLAFVAWGVLRSPDDPLSVTEVGLLLVISAVIVVGVDSLIVRLAARR